MTESSTQELKSAAVYAARLDHSWHNPSWTRNFNSIEWEPEVPCQSVPMALLVPGTAGRYLMTITRNCMIRIWELEPGVRRQRLRLEWRIKGAVLDVSMNSDPTNHATFAISHVLDRLVYMNRGHRFGLCFILPQDGAAHPLQSRVWSRDIILCCIQ